MREKDFGGRREGKDENILQLNVVAACHCEGINIHEIVNFKNKFCGI